MEYFLMQTIFLVRHAEVSLDLTVAAEHWKLSTAGQAWAERLAALSIFANLDTVWTSPEPKAQATAQPLAYRQSARLFIHPDLAELQRGPTNIPDRESYEAAVRNAFDQPEHSIEGWERAADAQRRIVGCVMSLAAETPGSFAIVSHGLVLALLLARLRGQPHVDVAEWRAIPLPALAIVDRATWRLVAPFQSVAAWEHTPRYHR
jgi:broad specificity phosphatase PhoE